MASDSTTANLSSRGSTGAAGSKGKQVLNYAEKSGDATVGPSDGADLSLAKPCAERIQPRILPLLGKPYFSCIMCKSHIQTPFQVVVPRSLAPFLPAATAPATVRWGGRRWEMRFTGGRQIQRLEAGWRGFAVESGLRLGDACVFELLDGAAVVFRVQVLRAYIPVAIRERAGGYTSSSPIVID
ncbi:hypothetical protein ACP4OV_013429 [Aristida adscensionis]